MCAAKSSRTSGCLTKVNVTMPSGVLHDATTALEDTVYTFICDGSVLYFDDNSFTGYLNWETIEKLRGAARALKAAE